MITLRHFARGTRNLARNLFFRLSVLQNKWCIDGQISFHDHDRAVMIHAERGDFISGLLAVQSYMDVGANAKHYALAAALVVGEESGARFGCGRELCGRRSRDTLRCGSRLEGRTEWTCRRDSGFRVRVSLRRRNFQTLKLQNASPQMMRSQDVEDEPETLRDQHPKNPFLATPALRPGPSRRDAQFPSRQPRLQPICASPDW